MLWDAGAMERLLDEHPDLDAVFVASDAMATAALRVLPTELVIRDSASRTPPDGRQLTDAG
ncbi:hypothetical protein [Streptomyces sp. NPDC059010]|uniref:hypothetical protein n=1 Tax=Streptomyces sp. NPDC059010 TaxID=3346695 RepID=UPI00369FA592